MAYNLSDRFNKPPKYYRLLDPGSYIVEASNSGKSTNGAPFLSKTPRKIYLNNNIWTHALYDAKMIRRIPNCASMMSKLPRLPYRAFSAEDLEEILCKCGIQDDCVCITDDKDKQTIPEIICQGKVKRRIFKGPAPRDASNDEGLSTPSRKDRGFEILCDGSQKRIFVQIKDSCPPFYDARVNEATEFYRGWKWSKWTSKRSQKSLEQRPGPGYYFLEKQPTDTEICMEKLRAFKRKTSKQLRFMEIVHQKNIKENQPGPASYTPKLPKSTDLQFWGAKANRFPKLKYETRPGPADHNIRRDLDSIADPEIYCHAILPVPAAFGTKANRFKTMYNVGPGPASYNVRRIPCTNVHCTIAPFGCSAKRFKENTVVESEEEDNILPVESLCSTTTQNMKIRSCPIPSWEFKSKTIRMKPLVKKLDESSPADFPQTQYETKRPPKLQYKAPFCSSEGRFYPWHTYIPVQGHSTPGPGYYNSEKPNCLPAFNYGPLYRAPRFPLSTSKTPAPKEYNEGGGVESILGTHNQRLRKNITNQHKFHWTPLVKPPRLTYEEREKNLLSETLAIFNDGLSSPNHESSHEDIIDNNDVNKNKTKMLRSFVYAKPMPKYF